MNKLILTVAGILALLYAGIFNLYPLVTPDTGAYLNSAFDFKVPQDRTVFYSLFIKFVSLKLSLWLVIIVQATLLYFLLYNFLRMFFKEFTDLQKTALIILITLTTSVSWFVSQVMPDIFAPIVFLSAFLLLFSDNLKKSTLYAIILFVAITSHNSHLIISLLFFIILLFLSFIINYLKEHRKRFTVLLSISILSWTAVISTNIYAGYGVTASNVSHVFLVAKLSENGILKRYLDDNCDKIPYKLCAFKNELPVHAWDFVWSSEGAFAKTGGWEDSRNEYRAILKATVTQPKYIKMHIVESIKASIFQVLLTYVGDGLNPHINGENPNPQVQSYFPNELNQYLKSKQNTGKLMLDSISFLYHIFFYISFLALPLFFIKSISTELKLVYASVILFVLLNAFVTASFANILGRLNARAIWLLTFFQFTLLVHYIAGLIRSRKSFNTANN